MSYAKVEEAVEVFVVFRSQRPEPVLFRWAERMYEVRDINLIYAERIGCEKVYFFSVSDGACAYRLSFRTESLVWRLEEMCVLDDCGVKRLL